MDVDDAAWAEARRLYATGTLSQAAIAAMLGLSAGRIRRRAKREGWVRQDPAGRRRQAKARPTGPVAATRRAEGKVTRAARCPRAVVVERLYLAIDAKLKRLEARMRSGKALSAADSERETRELGTMVRSFEKVTELAADIDRSQQSPATGRAGVTAADAERMRREIAERLERLDAARNAGG